MKKTIFTICLPVLAVCLLTLTGCPKAQETAPPTTPDATPTVPAGATSAEGHVEPLVPAAAPTVSVTPVFVGSYGKIAAEAIPMAPIADLVGQVDEYVARIAKNLDDLDGTVNYKNDADTIVRDANGLALVALSVGMAAEDSKYKKAAPAVIKAAMALAAVDKYDEAKKQLAALQAALTSEGDPASLQWTKVAALKPVMKAVPNLSSTLTRLTNTEKKLKRQIERDPARIYGGLAALAAIMQGSIANVTETEKPDKVAEWKQDCELFRDVALKANAAAHGFADGSVDYAGYWAAFKAMTDSCDKCHEVFYPGAVGKAE